jgi:hypothetical protein
MRNLKGNFPIVMRTERFALFRCSTSSTTTSTSAAALHLDPPLPPPATALN